MSVENELQSIVDKVKERRKGTLTEAATTRRNLGVTLIALGLIDRDDARDYGNLLVPGQANIGDPKAINELRDFINDNFSDVDFDALLAGETVKIGNIRLPGLPSRTLTGTTVSSLDEFLELVAQFDDAPNVSFLESLKEFDSLQGAINGLRTSQSEVEYYEEQIDALESGNTEEKVAAITAVELPAADLRKLEELGTPEPGTAYEDLDLQIISQIGSALSSLEPVTAEDEDADRKFMTPPAAPEAEKDQEDKPEGAVHPLYGRDTTEPERPAAFHPVYGEDRTAEQVEFDTVAGMSSAFIEARDAAGDFVVGLTEDGRAVRPDDPSAERTIRLDELFLQRNIDETSDEGIAEIGRLTKLTDWYNDNSAATRTFIEDWINTPSEAERFDILKYTIANIENVLRDIGQIGNFTDQDIFDMAYDIQSVNDHADTTLLRRAVIAEVEYSLDQSATSTTAQSANDLQSLARKYFVTLSDEKAADYAMQIYGGTLSESQLEMMFRDQATSRFPTLSNYLSDGFTVADYFSSYEAEMEQMLDRPVDLYTEFPQVFDYVTDTGEQRPMTFGEMREFARRMPEWQKSQQGQDQARNISFALAQMFGQAA
jgi:hypothetical protein